MSSRGVDRDYIYRYLPICEAKQNVFHRNREGGSKNRYGWLTTFDLSIRSYFIERGSAPVAVITVITVTLIISLSSMCNARPPLAKCVLRGSQKETLENQEQISVIPRSRVFKVFRPPS